MLFLEVSEVLRVLGAGRASPRLPAQSCSFSLCPGTGKSPQHHRGISNLGTGGVRQCSFSPGLGDSGLEDLLWSAGCQSDVFFSWFMELLTQTGEAPQHLQAHMQGCGPTSAWGPFPPFGENRIGLLLGWGW